MNCLIFLLSLHSALTVPESARHLIKNQVQAQIQGSLGLQSHFDKEDPKCVSYRYSYGAEELFIERDDGSRVVSWYYNDILDSQKLALPEEWKENTQQSLLVQKSLEHTVAMPKALPWLVGIAATVVVGVFAYKYLTKSKAGTPAPAPAVAAVAHPAPIPIAQPMAPPPSGVTRAHAL